MWFKNAAGSFHIPNFCEDAIAGSYQYVVIFLAGSELSFAN